MGFILHTLNHFKNRKASFVFPVLSVAISVISVIVISTVGAVGKNAVKSEIINLGVGNFMISPDNFYVEYLSMGELEAVRTAEAVASASPIIYDFTQIQNRFGKQDCVIWGVDQNAQSTMNLPLKHGRNISSFDVLNQNNVCLIEESYAKEIYGRENIIGKQISVFLSDSYETLTVVGITDSEQSLVKNIVSDYVPCFVYVPYSVLRQNSGDDMFSGIAVNLKEEIGDKQAEDNIIANLNDYSGYINAYKIENMMAHTKTVDNILNIITLILSGIAGISLVVSGISVMTVMMFSVGERTHEIGIKKSIGASFWDILFEFLIEAIFISIIGCVFGVCFGILLSVFACKMFSMPVIFDADMIGICVMVTAGFGLVFGIYPAICAAKLEPAVALRRN